MTLNARAWVSLIVLTAVLGVLLFATAGTIRYVEAWIFLGIYFFGSASLIAYLTRRDPALLERRMRGGPAAESSPTQKAVMSLASVAFVAILVVPALDHRFGWSDPGLLWAVAGDLLVVLSFYSFFVVFTANTFGAATIQLAENQRVITTGPYARVRHPMYAGGLLLFLGTPLGLRSWWGLAGFALALPAIVWRLLDEEQFLVANLPGYREYAARVRYRLLPGVF